MARSGPFFQHHLRVSRVLSFLMMAVFAWSFWGHAEEDFDISDLEKNPNQPYSSVQVLARAMQLIRQDYVDQKKTDFKELTYSALRGMLSELDPHSEFMDPESFRGMQEDTKSEFGGIGVALSVKSNTLTIVSVLEGTPGFQAGLMPGDRILKVNGTSTDHIPLPQAANLLRGQVGDKIALTIYRPATRVTKDYHMTRVAIKVPSVKDVQILPVDQTDGRKIGYIRITQFNEPTATELGAALEKLKKQGMEALLLDLRYNPGGLLNSAVDVCSYFLPPNTLVVSTDGRTPSREYYTTDSAGAYRELPMAILVNYASASGSEIVAGALKDLKHAVLVGETTFGKGSVQSVVALPDGSAIRLTTAKYYTPSRTLIHEHGVSPNIRIPLSYDEETTLLQSRRSGDSTLTGRGPASPNDPQINRAIDALVGYMIFQNRTGLRTST